MRDIVGVPGHSRDRSLLEDCPWLLCEGLEQSIPYLIKDFTSDAESSRTFLFPNLIRVLNKADPTGDKGKYTAWLVEAWLSDEIKLKVTGYIKALKANPDESDYLNLNNPRDGLLRQQQALWEKYLKVKFEDASTIKAQLTRFEELRKAHKLGSVKIKDLSYDELLELIEKHAPPAKADMSLMDSPPNKVLYQDKTYAYISVRKHGCLAQFGPRGKLPSNWCVTDSYVFKEYRPPFHLVLKDLQPYALMHYAVFQFMSRQDNPLKPVKFKELEQFINKRRFADNLRKMLKRVIDGEEKFVPNALTTAQNAYKAFPWVRKLKVWTSGLAIRAYANRELSPPQRSIDALIKKSHKDILSFLDKLYAEVWGSDKSKTFSSQQADDIIEALESAKLSVLARNTPVLLSLLSNTNIGSKRFEQALSSKRVKKLTVHNLTASVDYAVRVAKKPLPFIDEFFENATKIGRVTAREAANYSQVRGAWKVLSDILTAWPRVRTIRVYAYYTKKKLPRTLEDKYIRVYHAPQQEDLLDDATEAAGLLKEATARFTKDQLPGAHKLKRAYDALTELADSKHADKAGSRLGVPTATWARYVSKWSKKHTATLLLAEKTLRPYEYQSTRDALSGLRYSTKRSYWSRATALKTLYKKVKPPGFGL